MRRTHKVQHCIPASVAASFSCPIAVPEHALPRHPVEPPSREGSPPAPVSWQPVEPSSPQLLQRALFLLEAVPAVRFSPPRPTAKKKPLKKQPFLLLLLLFLQVFCITDECFSAISFSSDSNFNEVSLALFSSSSFRLISSS